MLNKYIIALSFADIDVDAQITFILNVCLQVSHLIVIIDPIDNEVGEPGVFSWSLE